MIKNVLITGASGFLGSHIVHDFRLADYNIYTLGRSPVKNVEKHLFCDLAEEIINLEGMSFSKVIHVAGKAHSIPKTESERNSFFKVNVNGTKNLLSSLDTLSSMPEVIINISTVAVYGKESGSLICEEAALMPITVYGKSKLESEKLIKKWGHFHEVSIINLRLPLVVGRNPPGNLGKMKKAILNGYYFKIKNNTAQRSIVLAQDVAQLIVDLPESASGVYHLTDGLHPSIMQIEQAIEQRLNKDVKVILPLAFINIFAKIGDILFNIGLRSPLNSISLQKIVSSLTFDDSKARKELGWHSTSVIDFIKRDI